MGIQFSGQVQLIGAKYGPSVTGDEFCLFQTAHGISDRGRLFFFTVQDKDFLRVNLNQLWYSPAFYRAYGTSKYVSFSFTNTANGENSKQSKSAELEGALCPIPAVSSSSSLASA